MIVRLQGERSRLAALSAYLAVLAIPVLLIAAIGHRAGFIDTASTFAVIALGFSLAALAVIAAVGALVVVWRDGRKGAGQAVRGLVIGLAILTMPGYGAWMVLNEPRLQEVSTDLVNPPDLSAAMADRGPGDLPVLPPDPDDADAQRDAYPDIVPRHYPVSTARVYEEVAALVARRDWRVLAAREPSETDPSGAIQGVATTLIFAFRQDVAIRIVPDGDGSLVDMRSQSRDSAHDLGANAARIRRFFRDLDQALAGVGNSG
jgi:uncharacterized protein (DUF1499 family)